MSKLQNTDTKCSVCNGAGHILDIRDIEMTTITKKCGACNGTGLNAMGRAMNDLQSVFVCEKCGANKVHYRKWGYRCPNRCEDENA